MRRAARRPPLPPARLPGAQLHPLLKDSIESWLAGIDSGPGRLYGVVHGARGRFPFVLNKRSPAATGKAAALSRSQ